MRQVVRFGVALVILMSCGAVAGCGGAGGSGLAKTQSTFTGEWLGTYLLPSHSIEVMGGMTDGAWGLQFSSGGHCAVSARDNYYGLTGVGDGSIDGTGYFSATYSWDNGGEETARGNLTRQPDGSWTGPVTIRWTKVGVAPGSAVGNSTMVNASFHVIHP